MLQADSGEILIDDLPYEKLNLYSLREAIGFVPQEAFLFSDTIKTMFCLALLRTGIWKKSLDIQKKAAVHDNIINFREGYETILGERGVTLSGGQKQRISIARALIKEPEILVFDDSLSAVDTETEEKILKNLKSEIKQKTSIIITHRISSAKNADQIMLIDNGQIVEYGSHEELIKKEGEYFSLYQQQLLETEEQ